MATSVLPKPTSPQTMRSMGCPLQVRQNFANRFSLVGSLFEGKRVSKSLVLQLAQRQCETGAAFAAGVEVQQFRCDIADLLCRAALARAH